MKSRTLIQSTVLLVAVLLIPFRLFGQFASFNDQAFLAQGGGNSLLTGLVAAWHLDEQVSSGNRVDAASGITWYDVGGVGSLRGVIGGAASITNTGTQYLSVTNSHFQGTGGFTLAFWVFGGNSTSAFMGQKKGDASASDWFVDAGPTFTVFDSGNTGHSISPTLVAGQWNFVVVGFDGSSQIFATANAGAKTTIACASVRATANMPFVNRWAEGGVDEVQFWSRALTSAEITQVYNSGFGLPYPFTVSDKGVLAESSYGWAVTNAGVTLGNTSSNALVGFIDGCVSDGVWSKVSYCLPFVSDSLTATLLPLVTKLAVDGGNAFSFWVYPVNHNFVSGDLTVNGLQGDGIGKFLDSGLAPSAIFSANSTAVAAYAYSISGSGVDTGTFGPASPNDVLLALSTSGNTDFDTYNFTIGQGRLEIVATGTGGYYCGSRTAANASNLYFANSGNVHASVGSIATVGGSLSSNKLFIFCACGNDGSTAFAFSSSRLSALMYCSGLSSGDSANLFTRLQAFRTALGGGFR